ncbi:MAG TPA: hypothetical protein VNS81_08215 [Nocardioides sp.]|nr:hypothetical protein [Nocardioides sp.]
MPSLQRNLTRTEQPTSDQSPSLSWTVGPDDPAVRRDLIRDAGVDVPAFGAPSWSLACLGGASGTQIVTLYFERTPSMRKSVRVPSSEWAESLRRIAYVLVNEEMPHTWVSREGTSRRGRLSAGTVGIVIAAIRDLMLWLEAKNVSRLDDVTPALLDVYFADITADDQVRSSRHHTLLSAVERLAHLGPLLPEQDRLCMPDWEASQAYDSKSEKPAGTATEVLDPAIADPMLMGAIAMVRDMASDILAAHDHVQHALSQPVSNDRQEASHILADLANSDGIPGWATGGDLRLDGIGLRYQYGIGQRDFGVALQRAGLQDRLVDRPILAAVDVQGHVGSRPWCRGLRVRDFDAKNGTGSMTAPLRHLRTACWIVLAFLSGARPEEVRHLPIDALDVVPPRRPDGPVRCLLRSHTRKGVKDDDGRASERGKPAEWVTLAIGADAVRVAVEIAERTHPGSDWLFPGPGLKERSKAIKHATMAKHVSDWVGWYNDLVAANGWGNAYLIPSDRGRMWDLSTFRRTTAWHIWNQPKGRQATRQQLQHADVVLSAAYANPGEVGLRTVMRQDERAAYDAMMSEVSDSIRRGGIHVSGPAADRLIEAAALSESVQVTFMGEREAATLSDIGQPVFDNPMAYSLCVFDPSLAKCMTSADLDGDPLGTPERGACQKDCACHARTDRQIDALRADIEDHRRGAGSGLTPEPLRVRLAQVADRKQAIVDEHERSKVFIDVGALSVRTEGDAASTANTPQPQLPPRR